jgi:AraC-like DNA-binding protein
LGFLGNHVHLDGWGISYAQYHGAFDLISAPSTGAYIVQFCVAGSGETRYGKRAVSLAPSGAAAVISPGERPGWTFGDDFAHFILKIDRSTLESHLRAITGYTGGESLEFHPVAPIDGELNVPLLRLVRLIVAELDRGDSLLRSPVVLAGFENALMHGLLTRQPHNLTRLWTTRLPIASSEHTRRAEEYLTAKLDQPIRMTDVAHELGISLRSLQLAFRQQRGESLTEFLRARRLDAARKRFLAGFPGTTVAGVALDCGFAHFGKFAAYYKARFAESPSDSLARGKRDKQA